MVQIEERDGSEAAKRRYRLDLDEELRARHYGRGMSHLVEPQDTNITHEY